MDESVIPKHLEKDVVLRDGRTVHLRPARSEDQGVVEDYLIGLSDESRRLRFWSTSIDVTDLAARAVRPEYPDHLTLLAVTGRDPGHVVGGAQFIRENATRAELSVSVSDELQGSGLGSLLVGNLVEAAYEAGIGMLEAQVLPENHRMIDVFRKSGFPISIRAKPGAVSVEIATAPTEDAVTHFEEREAVGGGERRAHHPGTGDRRRHRGFPGRGEHRRAPSSEPAQPSLQGHRLSGEPIGAGGPRGQGVRDDRRCPRPGRRRVHRGEGADSSRMWLKHAVGRACVASL